MLITSLFNTSNKNMHKTVRAIWVVLGLVALGGFNVALAADSNLDDMPWWHSFSLPFAIFAVLLFVAAVILRRRGKLIEQKMLVSHDILEVTLERTKREVDRVQQACELVSLIYYEFDLKKKNFTGDKGFYLLFVGEVRDSLSLEEVIEHVHPDDVHLMGAYDSLNNGDLAHNTVKVDGRIYDVNGELRYMRVYAKSYFDQDGVLVKRKGSMLDVTEEKNVQVELFRMNSQLKFIQRMTKVFIWKISLNDPENLIVEKDFFECIGMEYNGESRLPIAVFKKFLSAEDSEEVDFALKEKILKNIPHEMEVALYPNNGGEVKYFHTRSFGCEEESYVDEGVVMGISHDITDLKKAEEKAGNSEKMRALGRLASSIAHDFNTQLTGMLGFADLIKSENISDTVAEYIGLVIDSGEKSVELVKKLLDFSKNEYEEAVVINVDSLVNDSAIFISNLAGSAVSVRKVFVETGLGVLGSYNELQTSLLNLGINSRDAIGDDTGTIVFSVSSVYLTAEKAKKLQLKIAQYVVLSVSDNGAGMTDEVRRKALEPFFTTKTESNKAGLGLSTVHSVVSAIGGRVEIESVQGEGTTVKLYIPAVSVNVTPEAAQVDFGGVSKERKVKNMLLIDDDKTLVKLVTMQLEKAGYSVMGMDDPVEAVDYYKKNYSAFDLVILDMVMPKMNGSEVYKKLKEINSNVTAILMTGYAGEDLFEEAKKRGIKYFLNKPVTLTTLTQKVVEALEDNGQEVNNEI